MPYMKVFRDEFSRFNPVFRAMNAKETSDEWRPIIQRLEEKISAEPTCINLFHGVGPVLADPAFLCKEMKRSTRLVNRFFLHRL